MRSPGGPGTTRVATSNGFQNGPLPAPPHGRPLCSEHWLRNNPEKHSIAPESDEYHPLLRQFLFKTRRGRVYRGLFKMTGDVVYVLHIRGPGQELLRPEDFDE